MPIATSRCNLIRPLSFLSTASSSFSCEGAQLQFCSSAGRPAGRSADERRSAFRAPNSSPRLVCACHLKQVCQCAAHTQLARNIPLRDALLCAPLNSKSCAHQEPATCNSASKQQQERQQQQPIDGRKNPDHKTARKL